MPALTEVTPQNFSLCALDLKEALHTETLGMAGPVHLCELAKDLRGMQSLTSLKDPSRDWTFLENTGMVSRGAPGHVPV